MIFSVTVARVPNMKEMESGAVETIIIPPEAISAEAEGAAILQILARKYAKVL